jgi:hypothetical protein
MHVDPSAGCFQHTTFALERPSQVPYATSTLFILYLQLPDSPLPMQSVGGPSEEKSRNDESAAEPVSFPHELFPLLGESLQGMDAHRSVVSLATSSKAVRRAVQHSLARFHNLEYTLGEQLSSTEIPSNPEFRFTQLV